MDLVFLHGGAAAGKLTVAREISARTGYPVFHNHLVVDLLTTVFPFGLEPFVRLREQMWLAVMVDAARAGRSIIFTFAPESTVPTGFPARVRTAVEGAGGRVRFVRLLVDEREQERRLSATSRREFHKLTDVEVLRASRARAAEVEQPPADLEINTTRVLPDAAAARIIAHFGLQREEPHARNPDS